MLKIFVGFFVGSAEIFCRHFCRNFCRHFRRDYLQGAIHDHGGSRGHRCGRGHGRRVFEVGTVAMAELHWSLAVRSAAFAVWMALACTELLKHAALNSCFTDFFS